MSNTFGFTFGQPSQYAAEVAEKTATYHANIAAGMSHEAAIALYAAPSPTCPVCYRPVNASGRHNCPRGAWRRRA